MREIIVVWGGCPKCMKLRKVWGEMIRPGESIKCHICHTKLVEQVVKTEKVK